MSALGEIYIKAEKIEKILSVLKSKNMKGISITLSINDESNDYGQNISAYASQSKEDRDNKKEKFYIGNGKVFWTDGKVTIGTKKESNQKQGELNDLPF